MNIKCKHIISGCSGTIINEMKGTKSFPDQYGIRWDREAYTPKSGCHYYWTDKDQVEIISTPQ